jgi:energy-converting hydrogenase Eha subunit A
MLSRLFSPSNSSQNLQAHGQADQQSSWQSSWQSCAQALRHSLLIFFAVFTLSVVVTPAAYAFDNPDLLPDQPTPVIDLANFLPKGQEENLAKNLTDFEAETGWKLRVLTQFDRTPGLSIREFWGLNEKSVLLVADPRGGNILNFNVGDAVYKLLPRTFWVELQTRFGNLYFVRENGENGSIVEALESIKTCLQRNGCRVVPGLPREQWILTLITSVVGGLVCGFAAIPRKKGQMVAWQWALIFSPLWGILFFAFGLAPVLTRTTEWLPLVRNILGFVLGGVVAFLSPLLNQSSPSSET